LPVDNVLADLKNALAVRRTAILHAPPGAGKTTRVPPALLDEPWLQGRRIVMLAPRRLAARAAAYRMADYFGETVGRTVGYRMRLDTRIGPDTRIEVVTEGVLIRLLQSDPSLSGTGLVIFDEFHERHLESDLGLALCLDIQGVFNTDLRLLVMSATLDIEPLAAVLGDPEVVDCRGRSYPVETRYRPRQHGGKLEKAVAAAVQTAVSKDEGSILAFLPGAPEIRRTARLLQRAGLGAGWMTVPLYGNLSRRQQDRAIAVPPEGRRKVVLATNIAETSLTIDGIQVVVDGGFRRTPRFDTRSGMARLETLPVSRASADQRRGRAGRNAPGICYRLWSRQRQAILAPYDRPEIRETDLTALVLETAIWGVVDLQQLRWIDRPSPAAIQQARLLLIELEALDARGRATEHGRAMAGLALHPRLAHMVLKATAQGMGATACETAALLSERDILRFPPGESDADLQLRIEILRAVEDGRSHHDRRCSVEGSTARRVLKIAATLRRQLAIREDRNTAAISGRLLGWAYPDRIARRRPNTSGRYRMTNGRGAYFNQPEPLAAEEYLVAAELDGNPRDARIFLAAATDAATLFDQYAHCMAWDERVAWSPKDRAVKAVRTQSLWALNLRSEPLSDPDPDKVLAALIDGIRREGLNCLPWTPALRQWQARVGFLRRLFAVKGQWPDVSEPALIQTIENWLAPFLSGLYRLVDLKRINLSGALATLLTRPQQKKLDELAPVRLTVPSGSRIPIDYSGETPVLAVRVQEMFGVRSTPRIAAGRQPLLIHLLSPAGRPVQVTRDLSGFWQTGYPEVKKELKGRYPKHFWPDDPLTARPTARAKTRRKKPRC
jgi:ATP-dependent helicase HrpB